jgi:hypothetical protein
MWVFRIEKLPMKYDKGGEFSRPRPRFIDIEFSSDYKLHHTHKQRIATEFRVPLFEGFTMPPAENDGETAAMYKSLLLRPLRVDDSPLNEKPPDIRFAEAFQPLCTVADKEVDGNHAFATAWLEHSTSLANCATEAATRFLNRYEYKSLWETREVYDE